MSYYTLKATNAAPQPYRLGRPIPGPKWHGAMIFTPASIRRQVAILWLVVCGATSSAVVTAAEQSVTMLEVRIDRGVKYGTVEGIALFCDVYRPQGRGASPSDPVVLLVHGGAWSSGSRRYMSGYATRLARAGVVAVSIDYRLAPRWKFPAQLDDLRLAMGWLVQQRQRLGIDPERMGVFGYSAGGHLACLVGSLVDAPESTLAMTSRWRPDDQRWADLPVPLAVCAGAAPCDLRDVAHGGRGLKYFLGATPEENDQLYRLASPLSHVSAGDAATLLIHGDGDLIVPIDSSRRMHEAQRAAGVASELVCFPGKGHMTTFASSATGEAVVDFFKRQLTDVGDPGEVSLVAPASEAD